MTTQAQAPSYRELLPEALIEIWEERAALMEFDGGLSRDEAEWQAFLLLQAEHQPMRDTLHTPVPHLLPVDKADLRPPCPQCEVRQWRQGVTYYQCAPCGYRDGLTPGEILGRQEGTP